jgi:hypothetical protein
MSDLGEAVRCKKPIFVDKPLGGSLAEARQVAEFLDQQHIPGSVLLLFVMATSSGLNT